MNVCELTEYLFKDIVYSKQTEEAKHSIKATLAEEYKKEFEKEQNEVQAMGMILSQYATIENAGRLAGYKEEEIISWYSERKISEAKKLKNYFFKIKLRVIVIALMMVYFWM